MGESRCHHGIVDEVTIERLRGDDTGLNVPPRVGEPGHEITETGIHVAGSLERRFSSRHEPRRVFKACGVDDGCRDGALASGWHQTRLDRGRVRMLAHATPGLIADHVVDVHAPPGIPELFEVATGGHGQHAVGASEPPSSTFHFAKDQSRLVV